LRNCSANRSRFCPIAWVRKWKRAAAALRPGEVILLENVRFHIEEEGKVKREDARRKRPIPQKSRRFAPAFPSWVIFTSTMPSHGPPRAFLRGGGGFAHQGRRLPHAKGTGGFAAVLDNPQRPLLAILGGAKIADKIPLINNLLDKGE